MRVISGPTEWTKRAKCNGCGAVLEVSLGDVKEGSFGGCYGEPGESYVYVSCIVCGTEIKIGKFYSMPKLVQDRAMKNKNDRR